MLLEKRVVSRKTPLDGKLEISDEAAARLGRVGPHLRAVALGREDAASLETFTCTCGKRGGGSHIHHFVASPVLKELVEGSEVVLDLDEAARRVTVTPTPTGTGR